MCLSIKFNCDIHFSKSVKFHYFVIFVTIMVVSSEAYDINMLKTDTDTSNLRTKAEGRNSKKTEKCRSETKAKKNHFAKENSPIKKITRKRKNIKSESPSKKITDFFGKSPLKKISNVSAQTQPNGKKCNKSSARTDQDTYTKYGMKLPSFQEVLEQKKENENFKNKLMELFNGQIIVPEFKPKIFDYEPETSEITLDCKHLTCEQILKAFNSNLPYINDISEGKQYSERHEKFKKENYTLQNTSNSLTYATSIGAFTIDQKLFIAKLLQKQFKFKNFSNSQYLFKVLLPEICMKIFMDINNMSYKEASDYLEISPIN